MRHVGAGTFEVEPVLTAGVIRDPRELTLIEDDWRRLAEQRGNAFVTPEWFHAWLAHQGGPPACFAVVARDEEGAFAGILPLVRSGRLLRKLRFAGSRYADLIELVAAPDQERRAAAAVARALLSEQSSWHVLGLRHVDPAADWLEAFRGAADGVTFAVDRDDVLPAIELGGSWQAYLGTRSANLRSQLGRRRRTLERDHNARFRLVSDEAEVDSAMATLFRLHTARRATRGGSSLASADVQAAHTTFARSAAARGWLRLWLLEVDGAAVAAWYGWRLGSTTSYYSAGFDPAWAGSGVGLVLLARTIEHSAEEGCASYDLLLGNEPYKHRFATSERIVRRLVATSSHHPARAAVAAELAVARATRRLPHDMRRALRRRFSSARA